MKFQRLFLLAAAFCLFNNLAIAGRSFCLIPADSLKFYDAKKFVVIGQFHREANYNRFPENYKSKLRPEVWNLSQNAAGIAVRFRSNATALSIRWTLKGNVSLPHMPATGVGGLDLYANVNGHWQFIQTGRPKDKLNEYSLFEQSEPVEREYLLNLPL